MTDPRRRTVKMRINGSKYFYLPCEEAHKIREILDNNLIPSEKGCTYQISDLKKVI